MSELMNEKKYVLMSIKPVYAELIKSGEKTVELRRVLPKIKDGDVIVVYETAPIQRITMTCTVKGILSCEPCELWRDAGHQACVDYESFEEYFQGKDLANGLQLDNIKTLSKPLKLSEVIGTRRAPQSYCYLRDKEVEQLLQALNDT